MKITKLAEIHSRIAQQAWRLSRNLLRVPLEKVLAVDAPVNELPAYVLHFEDMMVLEREIFTTPRHHVIWARTSRVDDPLQFMVPGVYAGLVPVDAIRAAMQAAKGAGQIQDHWRSLLPLAAHTSWCGRLSLRDLVKMRDYFVYLADHVTPILRERFLDVADMLTLCAPINGVRYAPEQYLNEKPLRGAKLTSVYSHWQFITTTVPLMLRAQVVRHRPIMFVDNFFQLLRSSNVLTMNLNAPVRMQLCATASTWHAVTAKRNCWISQNELWQPLLQHSTALPCDDGHCPYAEDNRSRMQGNDPNPPCPIFLEMHYDAQERLIHQQAIAKHAENKPAWWQQRL
jgi:hypothetical protein